MEMPVLNPDYKIPKSMATKLTEKQIYKLQKIACCTTKEVSPRMLLELIKRIHMALKQTEISYDAYDVVHKIFDKTPVEDHWKIASKLLELKRWEIVRVIKEAKSDISLYKKLVRLAVGNRIWYYSGDIFRNSQ